VRCHYFDDGRCGSCAWLPQPYAEQVAAKERAAREAVGDDVVWLPTFEGPEHAFRNKAKMVVSGTVARPTLGLAEADLRECPLYTPAMHRVLEVLARFLTRAHVVPYDVAARTGEAKHVLVTESPDGEFLVRFVLRSQEPVARLRKHLGRLRAEAPEVVVVTANIQPAHSAVLEGELELVLTEQDTLPMRVGGIPLHLGPRSFFQTNTAVAAELYRQARAWVDRAAPASVLDLYCGVGGFALHLAADGRAVHGIEVSADAVAAAQRSAAQVGLPATFAAGDATTSPLTAELVLVNPPRRGLGPELCAALEASTAQWLVYSSCHVGSLARDLAALPTFAPREARVLDMFPHTGHFEVLVLAQRVSPAAPAPA